MRDTIFYFCPVGQVLAVRVVGIRPRARRFRMLKRRSLVAFIFFALAVLVGFSPAARAQISVSIGQPGVYGRIAIGGYPPPALIYPEPVIVHPAPVMHPPVYLRVPPKHMKQWQR